MATQITISAFFTNVDLITNNKFNGVTDAKKLAYLNRAILNRWLEMKSHCEQIVDGTAVLSTTVNSFELDLPSDMDQSAAASLLIFNDEARQDGVSSDLYRPFGGKVRFEYEITSDNLFYLEYNKEPSQYTSIGATLLESIDVRCLTILEIEVEKARDVDLRQGQFSPQAQSAELRANQIS